MFQEQVENTIITDRDYEQFIYVSRAAKKWKGKIKTKEAVEEHIETVEENKNNNKITTKLNTVFDENLDNGEVTGTSYDALMENEELEHPEEKNKFVTDV